MMTIIRKHRAPKGALRRAVVTAGVAVEFCQKAPSAKRCIKTPGSGHPQPEHYAGSESDERHQVY